MRDEKPAAFAARGRCSGDEEAWRCGGRNLRHGLTIMGAGGLRHVGATWLWHVDCLANQCIERGACLFDEDAPLASTPGRSASTSTRGQPHVGWTLEGGHCRRGFRRHRSREIAVPRARRGHRHRPAEPSLLPAAALPGRDRGALSGRRGLADPAYSPQAEERDRADGRSPRRRYRQAARANRFGEHPLRLSRARHRRRPFLFRPRRMGRGGARPQAHRGRDPHPAAHPDRLRARGAVRRRRPSASACSPS